MKARIDAQEFKRIINNTKKFIGSRELMSWIYLEIDAEEKLIKATALDGHRISIEYAKLNSADESCTCYIRPVIPGISRYDEYADLELEGNRLFVQVGESIIGYVQPEGQYYKVNDIIEQYYNKEKTITIGVNAKYLKEAMDSIGSSGLERKIAKIDLYNPGSPIIIRSGRREERENLKVILPVNIRHEDQ